MFSGLAIVAAVLLLGALGVRIVARVDLWQWWVPLAFLAGVADADFGSGLVHWGADSWGRDDLPVIGRRLLVPFQWAHLPSPPRLARALQACGVLLGRVEHTVHHRRPYDARITTGWCNRPLEALGFFRHLEAAIAWLTGVQPRHDDRRYEQRYGAPEMPGGTRHA